MICLSFFLPFEQLQQGVDAKHLARNVKLEPINLFVHCYCPLHCPGHPFRLVRVVSGAQAGLVFL